MNSELWATIRRLYEVEKISKSAIARRLAIHRWTVRQALKGVNKPPWDKRGRRPGKSKLDVYKNYLQDRLKIYPELSGAKLLKEIKEQGYAGSETVLLEYLRTIRTGRHPRVFLRLETQPGEFAQVDWMNVGTIAIGNATRKLSCFVMILSFSRMIYLEFTMSQRLEDFLQAHINAFDFFGGVPDKINYDNLKSVVVSRVGKDIRFQSRFMELAGLYLFDPIPCGVRMPHEKGKVENSIKFIRSAFLAGREITSFYKLQREAVAWRDKEANPRLHGTTHERPVDRFETEKKHLNPLPSPEFEVSLPVPIYANRQALVHFDANRYSVPYHYARQNLILKTNQHKLEVYNDNGRLLARHERCYEKFRVIENPAHYEGLLAERKKAKSAKRVDWFLSLDPECGVYLKGLGGTELHVPTHLEKIHDMFLHYGKAEVMSALLHALSFKAFGADYIQRIIHQQRAARNLTEPQPISLTKKPEWAKITVEQADLSLYDELFDQGEKDVL